MKIGTMLDKVCTKKKSQRPTCLHARDIFSTVHNLGVGKKMKVGQKGPMYTHSDFCMSTCIHVRTAA